MHVARDEIGESRPEFGVSIRSVEPDGSAEVSELFGAHHRRLVGLASLLVDDRQAAEDVVQDAFAALHRHWGRLRDQNTAVAYLNRAVVNGSRDVLRRGRRAERATLRLVPRPEALQSAEQGVVEHRRPTGCGPCDHCTVDAPTEVLVMRYYLDQSEAEIAEALGISRGSVKQHASRGLAALAQQWEEQS